MNSKFLLKIILLTFLFLSGCAGVTTKSPFTQEKIDRMRYLISDDEFMTEYTMDQKNDAVDFLESVKDKAKELSLRSLIMTTKIRKNNPRNAWKNLADYAICG